MKVTVEFGQHAKDAKGTLFSYKSEVGMEIPEDGLTPEQKVAKMRAINHFLHHELHLAIQEQMVKDGLLDAVQHEIVKPPAKA
jgi:hypothetical protein